MPEPKFSTVTTAEPDDDLPRTLRREREAQARRARAHEMPPAAPYPINASQPHVAAAAPPAYADDLIDPMPSAVTRLDVPFFHMMFFLIKAVIAGIPALVLLLAILWGVGEILTMTFPELIKMQVLIRMPN